MFGPRWLQVQHRFRVETAPILQAMPRNRFTASPSRASAAASASARGENGSISMVEPLRRQSAAARPAGDRPQAGPRVTQPDARPAGEITVTGRTVARQIAPGQFGQGGISIRRTGVGQPVAHQRKGMVGAGHRPAHDAPLDRRAKDEMDHRMLQVRDAGALQPIPQVGAGQRSLVGDRPLDHVHRPAGHVGIDPVLGQAGGAGGEQGRGRQQLEQRVIDAADQVQGSAIE